MGGWAVEYLEGEENRSHDTCAVNTKTKEDSNEKQKTNKKK